MCEKYGGGGAVLDVGCGEGLLRVPRYLGIDRIDADPLACLRRYERWLDGVFVISMYGVSKNRRVWRELESAYRVVDAGRARGRGRSWDVKVLRPIFTTPAR